MEGATETVNDPSYTLQMCTVSLYVPDDSELTAQWIWSSPLTEIRIVGCVWAIAEA